VNPIQTDCGSHRFRTRGEARFAVFFDACQLRYEYEPEGFWLDGAGKYLPDFWLPRLDLWFEVKSAVADSKSVLKCNCLADEKQQRVAMAYSSPGLDTMVACFNPGWEGHSLQTLPEFFMQWLSPEVVLRAITEAQSARFEFGETPSAVRLRLAAPKPLVEVPF
jgi:hypothetical protein